MTIIVNRIRNSGRKQPGNDRRTEKMLGTVDIILRNRKEWLLKRVDQKSQKQAVNYGKAAKTGRSITISGRIIKTDQQIRTLDE